METKLPFEVGDIVEVVGYKASFSSKSFLNKIGTIAGINDSDRGCAYMRRACAVVFEDIEEYEGHHCDGEIDGKWVVFAPEGHGQWFQYSDLALIARGTLQNIEVGGLL